MTQRMGSQMALVGFAALAMMLVSGCAPDAPRALERSVTKAAPAPLEAADEAPTASSSDDDWRPDDAVLSIGDRRDPFSIELPIICIWEEPEPPRIEGLVTDDSAEALQLIAIISGRVPHKAMVTDSDGIGHVIRRGDIVGLEDPMRVARITRNEVVFLALDESAAGDAGPQRVEKHLWNNEELRALN